MIRLPSEEEAFASKACGNKLFKFQMYFEGQWFKAEENDTCEKYRVKAAFLQFLSAYWDHALFQTHYWQKSSFFNTLIRVCAQKTGSQKPFLEFPKMRGSFMLHFDR